jgi:hypothetical protein
VRGDARDAASGCGGAALKSRQAGSRPGWSAGYDRVTMRATFRPCVRTLALVISLVAAGCQSPWKPAGQADLVALDAATLDVHEAVLRHMFSHDAAVAYHFVSVGGVDPSPALLDRFGRARPAVLPRSMADAAIDGVKHKENGGRGQCFDVGAVTWLGSGRARVDGSYYETGTGAAGWTFDVRYVGGKWVVAAEALLYVS